MQRKRAEIAEKLRQESEAVRAPVIRRLEARRTAAGIEQEQASLTFAQPTAASTVCILPASLQLQIKPLILVCQANVTCKAGMPGTVPACPALIASEWHCL